MVACSSLPSMCRRKERPASLVNKAACKCTESPPKHTAFVSASMAATGVLTYSLAAKAEAPPTSKKEQKNESRTGFFNKTGANDIGMENATIMPQTDKIESVLFLIMVAKLVSVVVAEVVSGASLLFESGSSLCKRKPLNKAQAICRT